MRAFVLLAVGIVPVSAFAQPPRVDALGDPLPERAIARLGTTRLTHYHWVQAVAFSPDGKTLASAGYGDGVWLWEWPSGKHIRTLRPANEYIHLMRYTPDGTRIVSLAGYGKLALSVWDAKTGELIVSVDAPPSKGSITGAGVVGNTVVVVPRIKVPLGTVPEYEKAAWVFDIRAKKWADPLERENPIIASGIDPDGKILVAEVVEGGVRVTSTEAGKVDRRIALAKKPVAAGFGPKAAWAGVVDEEGTFTTINLADAKPAFEPQKLPVKAFPIAFSADGKRAVMGVGSIGTAIWDLTTGKALHPLSKYAENFSKTGGSAAFTPDGKHIAAGYANAANSATFFDSTTGRRAEMFPGHRHSVTDFLFLSDGKELATGAHWLEGEDPILRAWDIKTGKVVRSTDTKGALYRMWSVDRGRKLITQTFYGPVRLWDAQTLADEGELIKYDGRTLQTVVWPDGSRIARLATSGDACHLLILDVKTGGETEVPLPKDRALADLAGNADTLIINAPREIHILPIEAPSSRRIITASVLGVPRVSPDGRFFAFAQRVAKDTQLLKVFEVRTAREVFSGELKAPTMAFAFSPVAPVLAADNGSGNVRLIDYITGKELLTFRAADGMLRRLEFSPDGTRLASAGGRLESCCAYVWDVADLKRAALPKATAEQLSGWAKSLTDPNPQAALRAAWELIARPEVALPVLKGAMDAVKPPDLKRVDALIADLASEDFKTREAATRELTRLGEAIRQPAADAFSRSKSPEQRKRLGEILDAIRRNPVSPAALFASRAVFVLERVGGKDAVAALRAAAKKGGVMGEEASAALARLGAIEKK